MARPPTTNVLLSRAIAACSVTFDELTGIGESLPLWANVLQYVDDPGGVDVRTLPGRACLSKRALTTGTKRVARIGLGELRDKALVLTPAGLAARDGWHPVADGLGRSWPSSEPLRAALVALVSRLELELPHFPTQYGTADSSMTGGPGQDWKPVARVADGGASSLSLTALLSQTFVALAIEYEARNGALGWSANVMAFVPAAGVAVSELPPAGRRLLGGMARHGWVTVDASSKRVSPTSWGRARRDTHEQTLAAIESAWCDRFGADVVDALRTSLAAAVASLPADTVDDVFHAPTAALFGYAAGRAA